MQGTNSVGWRLAAAGGGAGCCGAGAREEGSQETQRALGRGGGARGLGQLEQTDQSRLGPSRRQPNAGQAERGATNQRAERHSQRKREEDGGAGGGGGGAGALARPDQARLDTTRPKPVWRKKPWSPGEPNSSRGAREEQRAYWRRPRGRGGCMGRGAGRKLGGWGAVCAGEGRGGRGRRVRGAEEARGRETGRVQEGASWPTTPPAALRPPAQPVPWPAGPRARGGGAREGLHAARTSRLAVAGVVSLRGAPVHGREAPGGVEGHAGLNRAGHRPHTTGYLWHARGTCGGMATGGPKAPGPEGSKGKWEMAAGSPCETSRPMQAQQAGRAMTGSPASPLHCRPLHAPGPGVAAGSAAALAGEGTQTGRRRSRLGVVARRRAPCKAPCRPLHPSPSCPPLPPTHTDGASACRSTQRLVGY